MTVVLTRGEGGNVSKVAHHHLGGQRLACRPNGVIATTRIITAPVGREVDCVRCVKALAVGAPPSEGPVFDPWADDETTAIPKVAGEYEVLPAPGARSVSLGEVVGLITAAPLDATKPIRALGRFTSKSTLGVMVSRDGSLVIMSVD